MKILLVQPQTPITFWSFHHALKFVGKKATDPPLGLLTVAAMLPQEWQLKLVDLNVSVLRDRQLHWADYVFLTGMNVHLNSMKAVIERCNQMRTKVVLGGPLCTLDKWEFDGVDHFVLNEAETTLPEFIEDLKKGTAKQVYRSDGFPDLAQTPVPLWRLVNMNLYSSMTMQYSRGCPFNCEFCGISRLNGQKTRTKPIAGFLNELDALYDAGWRGDVFIVDDNFIGNKQILKTELLPELISWMRAHHHPFAFSTEVSINLSDNDELMQLMIDAGFDSVFIGIETPSDGSLKECNKKQNLHRDLNEAVQKLQRAGFIVSAGFIVGFDSDPPDIFDRQIRFIQQSGITTAMVGLLNAPTGTRLFARMKREERLTGIMTGNNMDNSMNFIPKMNYELLKSGYRRILRTIYAPPEYYGRLRTFLARYNLPKHRLPPIRLQNIKAFFKAIWILGIVEAQRKLFWQLILYCLVHFPKKLPVAITLAIYGFHFQKISATV